MSEEVHWLFRESGLTAQAHSVDEARLLGALREHYGLDGRLTRLDTEKDATYRLHASVVGERTPAESAFRRTASEGAEREFLVKVSQPEEPVDVVRCQVDVVAWIERQDPGIPVQTVLPALDGARWRRFTDAAGRFCGVLRVHEFIPGTVLAADDPPPARLRTVGAMLGRVDLALGAFAHPGEERVFVWDLSRFMQLESLVDLEPDEHRRSLARAVFDAYRERVAPALPTARTQVIHGDFSPFNVVVDPGAEPYVTGVIDFGDVARGPVVFDPAVLLGNHLLQAPHHPWIQARELLDGYRSAFPLSADEVGLVVIAAVARVTLRALIANWRLERGTERAEYVLEHAMHDWGRIENAMSLGIDTAHDFMLRDD